MSSKKDTDHCMVVSDEAVMRERLSFSLRLHNFDVISTADGMQALSLLEEKQAQGKEMSFAVIGYPIKSVSQLEMIMFMRSKYPDSALFSIFVYAPVRGPNEEGYSHQELQEAGASVIFEKFDLPVILKQIELLMNSVKKKAA